MICAMADEHDEFFNAPPTKESTTMSLEQTIAANTEAVLALTIALAAHHTPVIAGAAVTGPSKTAAQLPAAGTKTTPPASTGALDYEKDVKPLALRVAKEKTRDGLLKILGDFKVAQANLLTPAQWGPFITACNAALAAK